MKYQKRADGINADPCANQARRQEAARPAGSAPLLSEIAFERYEALYEHHLYSTKAYEMFSTEHQRFARRKVYEAVIAECSRPEPSKDRGG